MEPSFRIGQGCDVHRFEKGRRLVLGGVTIPFELGLAGHSDADALLHAVCDAVLGALALGDIGRHFPDTDPRYKDISSMELLEQVYRLMGTHKYVVGNVDATIILEKPKIAPYVDAMCTNIAKGLRLYKDQVSVKATTSEGLGFTGRSDGIAALAVVLLCKEP